MQGNVGKTARSQSQLRRQLQGTRFIEMRNQSVKHDVAHQVDTIRRTPLRDEVLTCGRFGGQQHGRKGVYQDAVDLFGHAAVK